MNRTHHASGPNTTGRTSFGARLAQSGNALFGVDPRSLAVFRIGVAGILLLDLWYRSREIGAFFTDEGILPRHVLISLNEFGSQSGYQHVWSLHMFSGQYWAQLLLILVSAFFGLWLLFGYRTRLSAVVSWVLLLSLDSRNPDILNSGDVLLRCMLLWALFLPLGSVWSIDRLVHRPLSKLPQRFANVASAALLLQLAMMYLFSAIAKMNPVWYWDLSGVYYALHCDAFVKPLGVALREYSGLTKLMTASSFGLELLGPILVFLPFWTSRIRVVLIAAFWTFHVGLAATMTLGLFPIICIVAWTVFVPTEFWDWLAARLQRFRHVSVVRRLVRYAARLRRRSKRRHSMFLAGAEKNRWRNQGARAWLINATLSMLLLYFVLWNVREARFWEQKVLPLEMTGIGRVLGLDQNWGMFSPIPRTDDGWIVMKGTLRDGSEVNLWQDRELPWEKPLRVSDTYVSQRWRKYLDNLTTDPYALRRLDFCEWLGRRWNERLAPGETARQVVLIELIHRIEATPPPGMPFPELENRSLYEYRPLYYE